jgi:hypothetical protein
LLILINRIIIGRENRLKRRPGYILRATYILPSVVNLRGAGAAVARVVRRLFDASPGFQISRDADGAEGVIAYQGVNARFFASPLHHHQGVGSVQWLAVQSLVGTTLEQGHVIYLKYKIYLADKSQE